MTKMSASPLKGLKRCRYRFDVREYKMGFELKKVSFNDVP